MRTPWCTSYLHKTGQYMRMCKLLARFFAHLPAGLRRLLARALHCCAPRAESLVHSTWCGDEHHQTQVTQAAQAAGWHYILLMLWLELKARAPAERVEKASAGFTLDQLASACQSKNLCNDAGLPQNHFFQPPQPTFP